LTIAGEDERADELRALLSKPARAPSAVVDFVKEKARRGR
jgi:hypothetical protein